MPPRSAVARIVDILEAIENIRGVMQGVSLEAFEADWQKRWLVERGVEIISEASRYVPQDVKQRHADVPWQKSPRSAMCCVTNISALHQPSSGRLPKASWTLLSAFADRSLRPERAQNSCSGR